MSSWNISYSLSSFMSWSSTTNNGGGNKHTRGQAYMREAHSNPTGSATRTTSQTLGQQPIQETRFYDARGRERLPYHANSQQRQPAAIAQGRVEEIADDDDQQQQPKAADKEYKEKRVTDGSA
ncbi:hypothetical protein BKA80DRAFT_309457 [Phyllosticta citrichinensis]